MTRKIGIIGLGHVGATLAHSMILKHTCDHLVLIDTNEKKVKADALDFCDTVANTGYPVHITVNDYAALEDADVVVSTLGNIELQANNTDDRFAELPFTSKQVVQVARDLKASGFSGVLLVVTMEILNLSLGVRSVSKDTPLPISSLKKSLTPSTTSPCVAATQSSLENSIPILGLQQQPNAWQKL